MRLQPRAAAIVDAVPTVLSSHHCGAIIAPMAALASTFARRPLDALALPLLDEAPFHLCDHAEDGEYNVAHLASGADVRVKDSDRGAALRALVDQVQDVASVAAESIKPRHHKFVAGAQELQDGS